MSHIALVTLVVRDYDEAIACTQCAHFRRTVAERVGIGP